MARVPWGHGVVRKQPEESSTWFGCQKRLSGATYILLAFMMLHLIFSQDGTNDMLVDPANHPSVQSKVKSKKKAAKAAAAATADGSSKAAAAAATTTGSENDGVDNVVDNNDIVDAAQPKPNNPEDIFDSVEDDDVQSNMFAVQGTIMDVIQNIQDTMNEIMEQKFEQIIQVEISEIVNDVMSESLKERLINNDETKLSVTDIMIIIESIKTKVSNYVNHEINDQLELYIGQVNDTIATIASNGQAEDMDAIEIDGALMEYETDLLEGTNNGDGSDVKSTVERVVEEKLEHLETKVANITIEQINIILTKAEKLVRVQIQDYDIVIVPKEAEVEAVPDAADAVVQENEEGNENNQNSRRLLRTVTTTTNSSR